MKIKLIELLRCTKCGDDVFIKDSIIQDNEVKEGILYCKKCGNEYPIINSIPRFIKTDMYADSFSFQWKKFPKVQLAMFDKTDFTEKSFIGCTGFSPKDVKGKLMLDVGVGAGRYSEVVSRWADGGGGRCGN